MVKSSPLSLSVIIPCYNEKDNIPLIVKRFTEIIKGRDNVEVILVNNGSTDGSAEIFATVLESLQDPRFRVVNVSKNKGYGHGILSGLNEAKNDVLAWTHADMQTDPIDVIIAFEKYIEYSDPSVFVKGRRYNRQPVPSFFTWLMGIIASTSFGVSLEDIGAQPKLFSKKFYENFLKKGAPSDFSLDLYAQYWAAKKGKIVEIPVFFNKRLHGDAKGGGNIITRLKVSKRTFHYILEMKRKLKS